MDNFVTRRGGTAPGPGINPSGSTPQGGDTAGAEHALRGSDLARAALEAAKAQAKARGIPKGRTAGSGSSSRSGSSRRRRRWSGPGADDRDPQPLGRLASRIVADRGWQGQLAGGHVFSRWAALVGDEVAEHAKPVTLQDGELTVQASSTAWATQLRLLQRQLLTKIAAGVGKDVVRRLKVQGPAAPSWRYGPRHVPGRGPRDTYG
ncbi:Predicted nucleic acid-binding protein, contains Zn-ribbon domain (includes truncated derivatives) [Allokutzneria albata]|uniref:UPF0232 protein SAMN04489726_5771 n=1 Tax=Allokutzneria albata TaxID=211114 RepID=A0A1G9ZX01_ALLAB|nr:Predicted nucleic acid-binding protein, contains Zn-ribbon domain (includes truncated derivatives) [Allokutzneria albata]